MQPSQSNIGLDLMSPISTEPQSTTAPPPKELLLDQQSESDLKYYALSRILSLFNGSRTIHEILANHIPSPLREYIIDIIVFLLQWHLLLPVHHYIVNLLANPATAAEFYAQQAPSNTDQSPSHVAQSKVSTASHPTSSAARHPQRRRSTSGDVGYYLSESEMSLDIEKHMDALNINKSNLTNNMEYANQQANNTFLNNVFTNTLSSDEHSTYEKMAMYLQGNYQSSKTVEEILWLCKVTERDLQKVLKKLPYLQKIKKVF